MFRLTTSAGFTLLELLVTLTIIAILTAIAVPQFNEYKARGYDTMASSDLRNIAIAEEAYFLDFEHYLPCTNVACSSLPGISGTSRGVTLEIETGDIGFTGTATHERGTGKIFAWNSELGGMQ